MVDDNMKFNKNDKNGCLLILGLCIIIWPIVFLSNKNETNTKATPSYEYSSGRGHAGRNSWARQQLEKNVHEEKQRQIEEFQREQAEKTHQYDNLIQQISTQKPRNKYQELWDECETLSSILDENGIDHDEPTYPMKYRELEYLRDDLINLMEENDIDY